jgi:hypothetical protein
VGHYIGGVCSLLSPFALESPQGIALWETSKTPSLIWSD